MAREIIPCISLQLTRDIFLYVSVNELAKPKLTLLNSVREHNQGDPKQTGHSLASSHIASLPNLLSSRRRKAKESLG
jgi:hypothetical protein